LNAQLTDTDGNGILDREELSTLIKRLGIPLKDPVLDADFIFGKFCRFIEMRELKLTPHAWSDTLDTNQNNECCFQEFANALEPAIAQYESKGFHMDVSLIS
jgi:hypothetical protein